jgi:hypothetical protein
MPESSTHSRLVAELVSWIATQYFGGDQGALLVDSPENSKFAKPPRIEGYGPDVFGQILPGGAVVIGEAKTAGDVENRHTHDQVKAFMKYCAVQPKSILVLAVPWHHTRYARSLLRNVGRSCGCTDVVATAVLEQLEG